MADSRKTQLFGDCAVRVKDTVHPENAHGMPYIGLEHITEGTLSLNGWGDASDVISNKARFQKGDILFGKLRPYFRKVVVAPFDGVCSTDIWVVRSQPGIDQRFLYYIMASLEFVEQATRASEGTKMPRAKWDYLEKLEYSIPPLPEQKAIAHVLGTLDDKIELNRRMNETLEAMARAIFKSWFVDFDPVRAKSEGRDTGLPKEISDLFPDSFVDSELGEIPKGWEVGCLSNISNISSGKRPEERQSEKDTQFYVPLYGGNGIMAYVKDVLFEEPILLTGRVGTLGSVFRITKPIWASDNTLVITPKDREYFEYLYFTLKMVDFISLNRGSTQPLVTQSDLQKQLTIVPSLSLIKLFHVFVAELFNKVDLNKDEIDSLAVMRDSLLPKLISGEVHVKEK
jgi:type I restriction enzyme S subunit